MHSTGSEHGHLELNVDRRSAPSFRANSGHEFDLSINMTLRLSREALNTPHNRLLFRLVSSSTKQNLVLCFGCISGNRNLDHHMGSEQLVREVRDDLEVDGNSVAKSVSAMLDRSKNHLSTYLV